jgi:uroporphyrinogen-III synthase
VPEGRRRQLLQELHRYDWLLFTSHHGVEALQKILAPAGERLARLKAKVVAIGPRTAASLEKLGRKPDLMPLDYSKKGIASELGRMSLTGQKILIPRSNLGLGDELVKVLRERGAAVDEVVLYETTTPSIPAARLKKALHHLDAATFTSASTVHGLFAALKKAKIPAKKAFNGAKIVAIGPSTAQALRENGVTRYSIPAPKGNWTLDGLVAAVLKSVNG